MLQIISKVQAPTQNIGKLYQFIKWENQLELQGKSTKTLIENQLLTSIKLHREEELPWRNSVS